jgi:hypothetical protein
MKFYHVDAKIGNKQVKLAQERFTWLMVELGLREDNYHCGTGLGGNNFQLLTLMSFQHSLEKSLGKDYGGVHCYYGAGADPYIDWEADWLINTPKKDIRAKLDEVFSTIKEEHKYLAVALADLAKSNSMRDTVMKYPDQFPKLIAALGQPYHFVSDQLPLDQLIIACVMCQELSAHLDSSTKLLSDKSFIQSIGSTLYDFPAEIILFAVRKYVAIDRLVRHNLDEDPVFGKTLDKVNKLV